MPQIIFRLMAAIRRLTATLLLVFCLSPSSRADDWPMWRCDAAASAVTGQRLADDLHLDWVLRLPPQQTAWRDDAAMKFDASYRPVVLGRRMFLTSTLNDSVRALDTRTGQEHWRVYTDGPLRMAPAAAEGRVFVTSDDGHLYCLSAESGKQLWRFRGGPSDRRLLGNERPVSTWPARGGPVVADGHVYFAAGVWPFMGTFVYALDAKTGHVVWNNDATSFTFRRLPHYGSTAFSGLSAQGQLLVGGDRLIVPGSKLAPAVFDRQSGRFIGYAQAGGPQTISDGRFAAASGEIFDVETGHGVTLQGLGRFSHAVLAKDAWYTSSGIYDPRSIKVRQVTARESHGNIPYQRFEGSISKVASLRATPWLLAGDRLVASRSGEIQLLDNTSGEKDPPIVWKTTVDGTPSHVLAADDRLFVVTAEGVIYCFGPESNDAGGREKNISRNALASGSTDEPGASAPRLMGVEMRSNEIDETRPDGKLSEARRDDARRLISAAGARDGYCLVLGLKDGGLVESLVKESRLHVVAVDRDPRRVDALRRRLDKAGVYGTRAAVMSADPADIEFAPYLASLITSEDPSSFVGRDDKYLSKIYRSLRPYGGGLCVKLSGGQRTTFESRLTGLELPGATMRSTGDLLVVRRDGPLPNSAPWLGQNADAGNTRCSRDQLVKPPLGVLWFGNALSNSLILPRHGEGPVEQVVGGRLVIEGPDSLNCTDVYTGRVLWTRDFPGLGKYYNSVKHQPGAHTIGSNFFAVGDAVYVSVDKSCHVLDPASGRTRRELKLPGGSAWQFLLVYEDLLIAGADPIIDHEQSPQRMYSPTSSRRLVVMDRASGKMLWSRTAGKSFRHYGIGAGNGKVFCIDRTSVEELLKLERRGQTPRETPTIFALDARTGDLVWQSQKHVGTRLTYSAEHDVLISAGALRGEDGQPLWYTEDGETYLEFGKWGPMIRGDTIFPQVRRSMDLFTGERRTWTDHQGREREWKYQRTHGCGPIAGSQHLLTFRSACAGFLDLLHDGGTGNLGGFRSGCTANLIAADGVLNAPDYTRTCGCAYQNRSSLALVHMPEVEYWTYGAKPSDGRIGFNFGAPGDRRSDDGTLWLAVPNIPDQMARDKTLWWGNEGAVDHDYVPLPDVPTEPADASAFYNHSSRISGDDGLPWVTGSGLEGVRKIKLPLYAVRTEEPFRVRLLFTEPTHERPGQRVFDVSVDGRKVISDLDLVRKTGGRRRTFVFDVDETTYSGRKDGRTPIVEIDLHARTGAALICGAEIIQQLEEEGPESDSEP